MSTHLPGFRSFYGFLHHFVLGKLATSSMRVKGGGHHVPGCGYGVRYGTAGSPGYRRSVLGTTLVNPPYQQP